ncbi:MAG: response regulator [Planctomycetes bacterium]|nr:response regulator [Planctomycetota bacterium]
MMRVMSPRGEPSVQPLSVLLVEDREDDAALLVRELRRGGFDPTWERVDAPEALRAALAARPWDVVLCDYSLPRMNGLEALAVVRAAAPDLPCIIVSGAIGEETAVEAMKAGASDYVMKDRPARLVAAVARELRERAERVERRRVEEALRQSQEQVRQLQKLETLGQLAAGVAHDFNNHLGVILGFGDLASAQLGPQHPVHVDLEEIGKACRQAAELTRRLLAFSRKQVLRMDAVDLNEVVAGMERMLGRVIGKDIRMSAVLAPGLPAIEADRTQLEQIILNLAVNSRDAMPGGGRLTLETALAPLDAAGAAACFGAAQPGRFVGLRIADSGCGMSDEVRAHLFEPFFTTKEAGKGTGLGLATVYGIVKQSGGQIAVASEVGHGTVVQVFLRPATGPPRPTAPIRHAAGALEGNESVLVVDASAALRTLARRILEPHGYAVRVAAAGADALRVAAAPADPIRLLVCDLVLPDMEGTELAECLLRMFPQMRVLFVSGYSRRAPAGPEPLGADTAFLQKPYGAATLLRKIRDLLDSPAPAAAVAAVLAPVDRSGS